MHKVKASANLCTAALTQLTRSSGMNSPKPKSLPSSRHVQFFQKSVNNADSLIQLFDVFVDLVSASDLQIACALMLT